MEQVKLNQPMMSFLAGVKVMVHSITNNLEGRGASLTVNDRSAYS